MPTLIFDGSSYDCEVAIKGADYIHLLDEKGCMTASFDGITDFSDYTLENGTYTDPTPEGYCRVAVVKDDGTIGMGEHTCADIGAGLSHIANVSLHVSETERENWNGKVDPDTVYSREETLSAATKTLLGLSADSVPDDAFGLVKNTLNIVEAALGGLAKIESGTYEGNRDDTTSENPLSLSFSFEPKFVFIGQARQGSSSNFFGFFYCLTLGASSFTYGGTVHTGGGSFYGVPAKLDGKTLYWYGHENYSFNSVGTYQYVAIG